MIMKRLYQILNLTMIEMILSPSTIGTKRGIVGIGQEKLRQYELQKRRYYYAIVTYDSMKTAIVISQCDQMDYEASPNVLDVRFVPIDMQFTNSTKECCQITMRIESAGSKYCTALQIAN